MMNQGGEKSLLPTNNPHYIAGCNGHFDSKIGVAWIEEIIHDIRRFLFTTCRMW